MEAVSVRCKHKHSIWSTKKTFHNNSGNKQSFCPPLIIVCRTCHRILSQISGVTSSPGEEKGLMGNGWEKAFWKGMPLLLCRQASKCNFHLFSCSGLNYFISHCYLFSGEKRIDLCLISKTTAVNTISIISRSFWRIFPSAKNVKHVSDMIVGFNFSLWISPPF